MNNELYTLSDAARVLGVRQHVLVYAMLSGRCPEPRRVGGRRLFTMDDLVRISELLKLEIIPTLARKGEQVGERGQHGRA